jgi:5-methylcytosine-specific restriction endonuclease McrA
MRYSRAERLIEFALGMQAANGSLNIASCSAAKIVNYSGDEQGRSSPQETNLEDDKKAWEIELTWNLLEKSSPAIYAIRRTWRSFRYEQQSGRCAYCQQLLIESEIFAKLHNSLTLDHMVPLAKGGPDTYENTVASCYACNQAKGMLDLAQFVTHPIRMERFATTNKPPLRLSRDQNSPHYSKPDLDRGVRVFLNGCERLDVHEYSTEKLWVSVRAGNVHNQSSGPLLIKFKGKIEVNYHDNLKDPMIDGIF